MAKKCKLTKNGETIYPCSTMDAIVHPTLKVPSSKLIGEINVSNLFPTGGTNGTNKYTLESAITKIPTDLRIVGIKCSFLSDAGMVEEWVYQGGTFTNPDSWMQGGSGSGGNMILEWNTDVATTRNQVPLKERKSLLQVSYKNENGDTINEQYIGKSYTDSDWTLDVNWISLDNDEIKRLIEQTSDRFKFIEQINSDSLTTEGCINRSSGNIVYGSYGYITDYIEANAYSNCISQFLDTQAQKPAYSLRAAFYDKDKKFIRYSLCKNDFDLKATYIIFYADRSSRDQFSVSLYKISSIEDMEVTVGNLVAKSTYGNKLNEIQFINQGRLFISSKGVISEAVLESYSISYAKIESDSFISLSCKSKKRILTDSIFLGITKEVPAKGTKLYSIILKYRDESEINFFVKGGYYIVFTKYVSSEDEDISENTPSLYYENIDSNNLFSSINLKSQMNICDLSMAIEKSYIGVNGNIYEHAGFNRTDFIYLDGKKMLYPLVWIGDIEKAELQVAFISFFDENKQFISYNNLRNSFIYVPNNTKYVVVSYYNDIDFPKVMVNTGDYVLNLESNEQENLFFIPKYIDCVSGVISNIYIDGTVREPDCNTSLIGVKNIDGSSIKMFENRVIQINISSASEKEIELYKQNNTNPEIIDYSSKAIIRVCNRPNTGEYSVLIVGDSLIASGYAANEAYKLLEQDGVTINQIGLNSNGGANHEGYNGAAWDWHIGSNSKFYYNGKLDFKTYLSTNFPEISKIDYCIVALGTNDVGTGYDVSYSKYLQIIDNAKKFVEAFFDSDTGFPDAKMAIGLIGLASAYDSDSKSKLIKNNFGKLNQLYIENFDNGNYHPNLTTIFHGPFIDRYNAYPISEVQVSDLLPNVSYKKCDNFIHPEEAGYRQWGRAFYNKIASWIAGNL